jgi:hypothetical protein
MGYDLHVTRGDGKPIGEAEWRAYVASDRELDLTGVAEAETPDGTLRYENPSLACWRGHPAGEQVWFDFRDGEVVVKNPDEPTIGKMLVMAAALRARVQGDDGEIYESPGGRPSPPPVSLAARVRAWLGRLRPMATIEPVGLPFVKGDRVRDFRGQIGTVAAIDGHADHGMGRIVVRLDDGRELTLTAIAHGLEPLRKDEDRA